MRWLYGSSISLCLAIVAFHLSQSVHTTRVTAPAGSFIGGTVAQGTVDQFLNIPFGAVPLRFAPPIPAASVTNYDATSQGPGCINADTMNGPRDPALSAPDPDIIPANQSEDCLNLNLFRPSGPAPATGWPVMVWIYGGAFTIGYNGGSRKINWFNGTSFAQNQGLIVVTPNYRLSVFGFPGGDGFVQEQKNPGLLDVVLALEWVKTNIRAFGGNLDLVTAFGVSAGAAIIDAISNSRGTSLFRAAILESGTSTLIESLDLTTRLLYTRNWNFLATSVGCTQSTQNLVIQCMRSRPYRELVDAIEAKKWQFAPVYDGGVTLVRDQYANRDNVPMMVGSNFLDGLDKNSETTNLTAILEPWRQVAALVVDAIAAGYDALYPVGEGKEFNNITDANAALQGDLIFNCPATCLALRASALGPAPIYRFIYNASFPNLAWAGRVGPTHAVEQPVVFGNFPLPTSPGQLALSAWMQSAWASFAKTGSPGSGWVPFTGSGREGEQVFNVIDETTPERKGGLEKRALMSRFGGSERCVPLLCGVYRTLSALPW